MEDMDLPLDLRDLLCGQGGCTAPYPCPEHQAFESAIAPPFLMCETGSSDDRLRGCTTPAECRARGACAKPLAPLPPLPKPEGLAQNWTAEQIAQAEALRSSYDRDPAAPTTIINDRPTLPLAGRQQQRAEMWERMDREHREREAEAARQLAQKAAEAEEEENTPTKPLPRIRPESGHGAEVMEPLPPPRCAKCNSVMVEGTEFNAPLCINSTCF